MEINTLDRITFDPLVMGGKPCIRGMRITVGTIVGLLAAGKSEQKILALYDYLEPQDISEALAFAAWRTEKLTAPLSNASMKILIDMNLSRQFRKSNLLYSLYKFRQLSIMLQLDRCL